MPEKKNRADCKGDGQPGIGRQTANILIFKRFCDIL